MPDRPPDHAGPVTPETGSTDAPSRSLSEILEELAVISHAQRGEASAMRGAVSELSRALARLFEMIRADRATQHTRIAELEEALAQAQAQIRELEAAGPEATAGPSPTDFDALRGAAERLRLRTEQLVQEAGTPAEAQARAEADAEAEAEVEESRIEAARLAVEASLAEEEAEAARRAADEAAAVVVEPAAPTHDEPFGKPGILRVFPGAVLPARRDDDLDIESELIFDEEPPRQAVAHAVPILAGTGPRPDAPSTASSNGAASTPAAPAADAAGPEDDARPVREPAATHASPTLVRRPEPVAIKPRAARRRRGLLRRRRIDARKLAGVDPTAGLRAMVGAVDHLWTAGHSLDLVVALTDGGAMHITGGDREPLRVDEVEPGTSARSTVTATSGQIVPLFGRLELSDEESAPLIHGSRRDADLLAGWIDRAQRLSAEPL